LHNGIADGRVGDRGKGIGVMATMMSVAVVAGLVTSPTVAISVTALAMAALVTWKVARFGGPPTPDGAAVNGHG
jgi:hypothetical protein